MWERSVGVWWVSVHTLGWSGDWRLVSVFWDYFLFYRCQLYLVAYRSVQCDDLSVLDSYDRSHVHTNTAIGNSFTSVWLISVWAIRCSLCMETVSLHFTGYLFWVHSERPLWKWGQPVMWGDVHSSGRLISHAVCCWGVLGNIKSHSETVFFIM